VVTTWMKLAIRDQILPDEPEDSDEDEDLEEREDLDEHDDLDEHEGPENPAGVDDASRATKDS
jgi:hypothetical protein